MDITGPVPQGYSASVPLLCESDIPVSCIYFTLPSFTQYMLQFQKLHPRYHLGIRGYPAAIRDSDFSRRTSHVINSGHYKDTEGGHCQGACRLLWFFYIPPLLTVSIVNARKQNFQKHVSKLVESLTDKRSMSYVTALVLKEAGVDTVDSKKGVNFGCCLPLY